MAAWEENVRRVIPYTPGEQPKRTDVVKLNTNENPFPPSPLVLQAIRDAADDSLRRYPDPKASALTEALAKRYGREAEEVFVGVGSDDVLAMCFLTFFNNREKPILFPDITYSFYDVWAELYGISYETCPVDDAFRIRKEDYLRPNGGIVFPNPNAPTGRAMSVGEVEEIVAGNPGSVVIVDEAYVDFGAESAAGLIPRYDNLLVVQTFSKSRSLAGMRIGFAMGCAKLIRYLNDVKYSFNSYTMNRTAIAAGVAAVEDEAYFKKTVAEIIRLREAAEKRFALLGFRFVPSRTNFLFVTHPEMPAGEIFTALKSRGIFVRYFNKPRIDDYLRVTIGTEAEMERLFTALGEILPKKEADA